MVGTAAEAITGIEDDDNFYELVRQLSGLAERDHAIELTKQVLLPIAWRLPTEYRHGFVVKLPHEVHDFIDGAAAPGDETSLAELEHQLQSRWNVDIEKAARFVAAVGLAVADRLSSGPEELAELRGRLPVELLVLFPERSTAHL